MEQIFERTIHDCPEWMLAQARKTSQQGDPTVQSNSSEEETSTVILPTQPTHPAVKSDPAEGQPPQPLQTLPAQPPGYPVFGFQFPAPTGGRPTAQPPAFNFGPASVPSRPQVTVYS